MNEVRDRETMRREFQANAFVRTQAVRRFLNFPNCPKTTTPKAFNVFITSVNLVSCPDLQALNFAVTSADLAKSEWAQNNEWAR